MDDGVVSISGDHVEMGTLTEIAKSVRLVDETELPRPPMRLYDDDFGPVVATTRDGDHELRANTDGESFELTVDGVASVWNYRTWPDSPVEGNYSSQDGFTIYGMAKPDVAQLVFDFDNGDQPMTVVPGDLTGTFRHQFFIVEVPERAIRETESSETTTMSALDANGNQLAIYSVTMDSGMRKLDADQ